MATSHCLCASFLYHRPCWHNHLILSCSGDFPPPSCLRLSNPASSTQTLADIRNPAAHASFVSITASSNQIRKERRALLLALLLEDPFDLRFHASSVHGVLGKTRGLS